MKRIIRLQNTAPQRVSSAHRIPQTRAARARAAPGVCLGGNAGAGLAVAAHRVPAELSLLLERPGHQEVDDPDEIYVPRRLPAPELGQRRVHRALLRA
eukprot:1497136-Rhodomonas_salina.1